MGTHRLPRLCSESGTGELSACWSSFELFLSLSPKKNEMLRVCFGRRGGFAVVGGVRELPPERPSGGLSHAHWPVSLCGRLRRRAPHLHFQRVLALIAWDTQFAGATDLLSIDGIGVSCDHVYRSLLPFVGPAHSRPSCLGR